MAVARLNADPVFPDKEGMQTCEVHYDSIRNGALEAAFRPRYSGFYPANGDERRPQRQCNEPHRVEAKM